MYKAIAAAVAAVFGLGLSAQAADLGGGSFKDAPVAYGPGHSWAGFYVGASAGFGAGDVADKLTINTEELGFPSTATSKSEDDIRGAIYGAHIGYVWQIGHIVAGLEAGINGADVDGSVEVFNGEGIINTELNWYATAVARLGYAQGSWLLYGFGGIAWGSVDTKGVDGFNGETFGSGGTDHIGWTAGLGVEYALNDRFMIRAEYAHVDLGEESASLGTVDYGFGRSSFENGVDLEFDAIKIGVNYKLFGGDRGIEPLK
jgi:outer membrane immunogenic protein